MPLGLIKTKTCREILSFGKNRKFDIISFYLLH